MAIQFQAYSNVSGRNATVNVDIQAQFVAKDSGAGANFEMDYFISASTQNRNTQNQVIPVKHARGLDSLALNGQSQSATNSSADYSNVKELVQDLVYDIVNGHDANQFGSGVSEQLPINLGQ